MTKTSRTKLMLFFLLSILIFTDPLLAYDPATDASFEVAIKLFYQHKWEQAFEAFQEIARTASDPEAVVNARHWSSGCLERLDQVEEAKAQIDLILQEDPNSSRKMEFEAHRAVIGLGPAEFQERAYAARSILEKYSAPSLQEVFDSPAESKARLRTFAEEEQRVLIGLIDEQDWIDPLSPQDKVKLAIFIREFGPLAENLGSPSSTLVSCYRTVNSVEDFEYAEDTQSPEIFAKYPEGDVNGAIEAIRFVVRDGPIDQRQVDLASLEVNLDGDPLPTFEIKTEFRLTPGEPYAEILTITVPVNQLAPGEHSVRVNLADTGGNAGLTEWTFRVPELPSEPTTQILPATKDALIDNFDRNGNEGANKILALDKLLGRSSRGLVGFDLSEVDTDNLTRATLVLSIHKEERIFGCGPGESVSVYPLTTPWVEGNGRAYKVLPFSHRFRGSGSGSTWQRDTDTNIANLVANGGTAWTGASSKVGPATAPPVLARDDMEGTLEFDVTDDVLDGAQNGWLIRKNHENRASRISFYSKEGAAAKGDSELAPRLILEYGGQTAMSGPQKFSAAVAKFFGLEIQPASLQASAGATEGPRGVKEFLRGSARSAYIGEQVLLGFAGRHPLAQLGTRVVFRSWLRETPSLV
jgi:hypothetical protein